MNLSPNDRHCHLEPTRAAKDFANNVRRFSLGEIASRLCVPSPRFG